MFRLSSPYMQKAWQHIRQWLRLLLQDEKQDGKNTIAVLDGVRAFAIIFVLTFHINRTTGDNLWNMYQYQLASAISTAGGSGVVLFFVLSGFLLFLPYARALLFNTSWPSARLFYLRRVLRIVPAYYVSLFLIILLFQPQYLRPDHLQDLGLFLTFYMDSTRQTFRVLNGPFWTLAIEWQFYMLLPLLTWAIGIVVQRLSPQHRLRGVIVCLLAIIAGGLCLRFWGIYLSQNPTQTFLVPRSVLNVALFFLYGMQGKYLEVFAVGMLISLCYVYSQQTGAMKRFTIAAKRISPWLWGTGILILLFAALWHFNAEYHGMPFLNFLKPTYLWLNDMCFSIGYGASMTAILFGSAALKRLFEWTLLRWIGWISYSLYMWHLPLIIVLKDDILTHLPSLDRYTTYSLYWLWAFLIIIPFALFSYLSVEKPWMRIGDQLRRNINQRRLVA